MNIERKFGLPVVNSENINAVLEQIGITKWEMVEEPQDLNSYLKYRSISEINRLLRFIPVDEVASFKQPDGQIFRGVRRTITDGVVTFTILPGNLVAICAEFKHGIEEVSVNLPGGGNHHNEKHSHVAKEEFEQETGIVLREVVGLSPLGISSDARIHKSRTFYFLGVVDDPPVVQVKKLDENEILEPLLIPLKEWLKLIEINKVIDGQSVICTYLALAKMGYVKV